MPNFEFHVQRRVEGKGCEHGVQPGPGIGGGVREIEGEASDAGGGCDGREGIMQIAYTRRAGVREWQEDVELRGFGVQFHAVNCGQAEELSKGTKGVGNWSRPRGVVLDRYVVERWILGCHKSWPTLQLGVLLRYIDECEVNGCVKYLSEEMMLRGERPDLGDQRAGLQIHPRFYKMYKALGRQFRHEKRIQLSHVTKGLVPELTEIATL
ncbi:hypothetical protein B0H14DRAFT_2592842 [Mycena olivaceomarginata]|nr:hypothetical protein B0H14DRAFT_2592842 [Mycena olivaceomarginata]